MKRLRYNRKTGFSLIENMFAMGIVSLGFLSTMSLIQFSRLHNSLEQERARAHQVVWETMEEQVILPLSANIVPGTQTQIWDNGTPCAETPCATDDPAKGDDTEGVLTVRVINIATGEVATAPPLPLTFSDQICEVEVSLNWIPRGFIAKKLEDGVSVDRIYVETASTYVVPQLIP